MSMERGDNMLRGCQQHLLSQVDTAGNTGWKENRREQGWERGRRRGKDNKKGRRSKLRECHPSQNTVHS